MATTPISNGSGALVAEELLQNLTSDLARTVSNPSHSSDPAGAAGPADSPKPGVIPASATAQSAAVQAVGLPPFTVRPPATAAGDVASFLLAEVATSDLTKLTRVLEPASNPVNNRILDSLLVRAVQEVSKGNVERAVGYLADFATRDPRRAEALPMEPGLVDVRDKIESMVNRMTIVAKISAQDGLSRAEQTSSQTAGKLAHWDTHADVLIKLANRFFEAGGYANYARTTEITRLVSDDSAPSEVKATAHAMAALAPNTLAASAATGAAGNQMLPGVNIPYWADPDIPALRTTEKGYVLTPRRRPGNPLEDALQNMQDLKAITASALGLLWLRAPLLVMLLAWFAAGLSGGIAFAIASRIWVDGSIVAVGNFAFGLWGIGFLALICFGFYTRIRQPR